jgi:hypothetical protein
LAASDSANRLLGYPADARRLISADALGLEGVLICVPSTSPSG